MVLIDELLVIICDPYCEVEQQATCNKEEEEEEEEGQVP
jgi:hypothetical protein